VLEFQDKLTACWTVPVPLPVSISVVGELVALLRKDNDAVAVPDACGRNVTVKGSD